MESTERKVLPLIGERFPQLKVKTTHGVKTLPDDYKGKWFVLFSHPGDFTPVCTTEFMEFERKRPEFNKLNCELIGLSVDQVFAHIKWVEWIREKTGVEIGFPVIGDELGRVANTLGMIHPNKGTNTVRSVFIVDDQGIVRIVLHYPQEIGRNIDEILRTVKALRTSDANEVALPAGWPDNPDLGDKVIIPPASTEAEAKERLSKAKSGELECRDWWFCYRKLP